MLARMQAQASVSAENGTCSTSGGSWQCESGNVSMGPCNVARLYLQHK
jgi:hypothetical protein